MTPPAIPANDATKANNHELFGMSLALMPEPEVLKATLQNVQCKSLAKLVANLIADNEPLLMADADGVTVTVREVGGTGRMKITVEAVG